MLIIWIDVVLAVKRSMPKLQTALYSTEVIHLKMSKNDAAFFFTTLAL